MSTETSGTRATTLRITSPSGEVSGVELGSGPVMVGRTAPDHHPDVVLEPDPQRWIGRVHCTFEIVDGAWTVTDNASVNGTLLRRKGQTTRLAGRTRLVHGDILLVLGDMTADGLSLYWQLTLLDPHTTQPGPDTGTLPPGPCVSYDWVSSTAYRHQNEQRSAIVGLRPQGHQLLRYMISRSGSTPLAAFEHHELITALWGPSQEWPAYRSYDRGDLAVVVRAVRLCLEPEPAAPRILETVKAFGYRLHVCPDSENGAR